VRREPRLDAEGFARIFPVSRETLSRLEAYLALLATWSARINLVSRATLADPWRRHILDAAQLRPLIPANAQSLVDLGSGAGLPGLVLAILGLSGVAVELVEADSRKCAFLAEAARIAGARVAVRRTRIEAMPARPFDIVTARALAPLDRLLALAEPFLGEGSLCLFPKGARAAQELTLARRHWTMTVEPIESRSDPRGVVLQLRDIGRVPRRA
jgi:16S rRNA (guanine527-N7)-methyltransferase